MTKQYSKDAVVLIGVLKQERDFELLLNEHWYRIPLGRAPKREFHYLAFYESARFGKNGKRIRYYAKILERRTFLRREILPLEFSHPRAGESYLWFRLGRIWALPRPIMNKLPRRISFAFTTLSLLLRSRTILQLYGVARTEEIVARALKRAGIHAKPQHWVTGERKRYCLDFAVFCKRGKIAIECDNAKAHSGPQMRVKDVAKDMFLSCHGWKVVRFSEARIISDLNGCIALVSCLVRKYNIL